MPFYITLTPPYILVSSSASLNSLIDANNISQWGYVEQINDSTTGYAVGDVVYYKTQNQSIFQDVTTDLFYNVVDENEIMFIEQAP
jgi:hypothetical protein